MMHRQKNIKIATYVSYTFAAWLKV